MSLPETRQAALIVHMGFSPHTPEFDPKHENYDRYLSRVEPHKETIITTRDGATIRIPGWYTKVSRLPWGSGNYVLEGDDDYRVIINSNNGYFLVERCPAEILWVSYPMLPLPGVSSQTSKETTSTKRESLYPGTRCSSWGEVGTTASTSGSSPRQFSMRRLVGSRRRGNATCTCIVQRLRHDASVLTCAWRLLLTLKFTPSARAEPPTASAPVLSVRGLCIF